jgi:hypothetical protein
MYKRSTLWYLSCLLFFFHCISYISFSLLLHFFRFLFVDYFFSIHFIFPFFSLFIYLFIFIPSSSSCSLFVLFFMIFLFYIFVCLLWIFALHDKFVLAIIGSYSDSYSNFFLTLYLFVQDDIQTCSSYNNKLF